MSAVKVLSEDELACETLKQNPMRKWLCICEREHGVAESKELSTCLLAVMAHGIQVSMERNLEIVFVDDVPFLTWCVFLYLCLCSFSFFEGG